MEKCPICKKKVENGADGMMEHYTVCEGNKSKYQTLYETSYGIVNAVFKNELTFEEAEDLGKDYCELNGFRYIATEKVTN